MIYTDFVRRKLAAIPPVGIAPTDYLAGPLFPHQDALCRWAIRRGRAAVFADTGLGKTRIQLAWADAIHRETGHDVLILAPLAVAEQTVEEGAGIGVTVNHARTGDDVAHGINITNYERLHRFDAERFGAVVLDESSCIKHHDTKTLAMLLAAFRQTPYKLCATATPAPNDWTELGTHAEFLNVCTQAEMLSEYFVHDGGETQVWRLKGHAREEFWRWVASWGALVRSPADLGFDGSAYVLPPLNVAQHISETDAEAAEGMLFAMEASTLSERRAARKASMEHRVRDCELTVKSEWSNFAPRSGLPLEPWIIWVDLNSEQDALERAFGDLAFSVRGNQQAEHKEDQIKRWLRGERPVMISKPSIMGWGINAQHCARMAFVGVTDSFEAYYQAVRRCWRFGQKRPVNVHIFASHLEGAIIANLRRKEADALAMSESLAAQTGAAVCDAVLGSIHSTNDYNATRAVKLPAFMRASV